MEKIRPCVLVELETHPSDEYDNDGGSSPSPTSSSSRDQVFLQQAETVRLGQTSGNFLRVTDLEAQTSINGKKVNRESLLLRVMTTGTRVGKIYTGKVEER